MHRFFIIAALALAAACDASSRIAAPPMPPPLRADRFGRPDIVVPAGGSIQAAVVAAAPGAVIAIEPGTYLEAVHVAVPGLKLVGLRGRDGAGVTIVNPGTEQNGVTVDPGGDGFALVNVTVRGFEENGVLLSGVHGFLLSEVTALDNGEYGVFPVHSSHGVIERCRASGHNDTGIYVGQDTGVTVRQSVAYGNVNGIEFENSRDVRAFANETYDNVVGILVVLLPGLDAKTSSDVLVAGNDVHDNNHANFAPPGDLASFVPSGSGILVVGADRVTVSENRVSGNQFVGIGVASTLVLGTLAGLPPEAFADIEPDPDFDRIVDNVVTGNGGAGSPIPFLPAVDLLWIPAGMGNCWSGNTFDTNFPDALPACP
jgi:parallel beta-helix repeat protein